MQPDFVEMLLNAPRAMAGGFLLPGLAAVGILVLAVVAVTTLRRMRRLESDVAALRADLKSTRDSGLPTAASSLQAQPTEH